MDWSRRPEQDTPRMAQREFRDERGRRWTGSVTSGTVEGGEDRAEIIFVCRDQPSAQKRVGSLDVPPRRAEDRWRAMDDREIVDVFRQADPA